MAGHPHPFRFALKLATLAKKKEKRRKKNGGRDTRSSKQISQEKKVREQTF